MANFVSLIWGLIMQWICRFFFLAATLSPLVHSAELKAKIDVKVKGVNLEKAELGLNGVVEVVLKASRNTQTHMLPHHLFIMIDTIIWPTEITTISNVGKREL